MNDTFERVIGDFETYVRTWTNRRDEIPYEIKTSTIREIIRTRSIDTGRFIQAVDFREESADARGYHFVIDSERDSEVTYDGFLEFGTQKNGTILLYPRYNYKGGIENADIERIADDFADSSFAR